MLKSVLLSLGCISCIAACSQNTEELTSTSSTRVHQVNHSLTLTSTDSTPGSSPLSNQDSKGKFASSGASNTFIYVASVDPPSIPYNGRSIQATSFAVSGNYAYVVYNEAGSQVFGALDIMDFSNPGVLRIVSSTLFPTAEFSDIQVNNSTAYLVGTRSDAPGGAILKTINIADATHPYELATLSLPSYYATSLNLHNNTVLVTTGDAGGLVQVDATDPTKPSITTMTPLNNALSVLWNGTGNGSRANDALVLGGNGNTGVYAASGGSLTALQTISSQPTAAPGRMRLYNNRYVLTNAGSSGLTIFDINGKSANTSIVARSTLSGTGNGIDVALNLAFLAQGEAGTSVYSIINPALPISLGLFQFPEDRGSANNVRYGVINNTSYVFLSDGSGGFRVVQFSAPTGTSSGANDGHQD